jgi:hypothetical protein
MKFLSEDELSWLLSGFVLSYVAAVLLGQMWLPAAVLLGMTLYWILKPESWD